MTAPKTESTLHLLAELPGHDERAWSIAWNPTRPLLASTSADKTVRLWTYTLPSTSKPTSDPSLEHVEPTINSSSAWTFKNAGTIETGHTKTVRSLNWSPSGTSLATASFDASVGIWEHPSLTGGGSELPTFGGGGGGGGGGSGPSNAGWECASLLEGHENECKSVAYSASGTLVASCARDKTVWIWEVMEDGEFECAAVLMEHTQDVKAVAWHPNEDILASASYDDLIHVYTDDGGADDWASTSVLKGHASTVWSISFSPYGEHLASVSDDRSLRIWKRGGKGNRDRWGPSALLEDVHERTVYSVAWAKGPERSEVEGRKNLGLLASAGADGRINVWSVSESADGTSPPELVLIARHERAHGDHDLNTIAWCPLPGGENVLASAGDDGYVRIWEVRLQ